MVKKKQTFTVEILQKHCKELFGVEPEVFDGAFYGVVEEVTKEEAQKKIDAFLKKEVTK